MTPAPSASSAIPFPEAGLPERLAPPAALDADQQQAADELIRGPRRGVYGPFRPLLHRPPLLRALAKVGETLRFEGRLDGALREWTICVVARELGNVFEWDMHLPLAAAAGVPAAALAALDAQAALPPDLPDLGADVVADVGPGAPWALARAVVQQLLATHRLDDATYDAALRTWGEGALVELLTLVGYFAAVCWLMNVARTPGPVATAR